MFTFQDPPELRTGRRTFRNAVVGGVALAVVAAPTYIGLKKLGDEKTYNTILQTTEKSPHACVVDTPSVEKMLPGGDAKVQIIEQVNQQNKIDKLGILCLRLISTGNSVGAYREMSLSVEPKGRSSSEGESDTGDFGYSTDWVVVYPNNPVEVVAAVDDPRQRIVDPASITVRFVLMYPVTNVSNELEYGDPVISDYYTDPAAVTA